jgi:protoporphyrinogen oxidase
MTKPSQIAILGGGPAGLAVGYYARKRGLDFSIYEAGDRVGGNCVTHRHGEFRFDSGAHRLHDRDPEITREVQQLLGDDLRLIDVPSQIYDDGRLIRFPLSPAQLLRHLGPVTFSKAGLEVVRTRLDGAPADDNFESFAVAKYGATIASRFLLNYSEKLWGARPVELSTTVAGNRLSGLDLRTFVAESLGLSSRAHVEGRFYYPKLGIGAIADALARVCGERNIHTGSSVTRMLHDGRRLTAIEIGGQRRIDVATVVSSLPLTLTLRMLDPPPPREVLELTDRIRYRQVRLVVLWIDRPSVTRAATVYFPSSRFEFTRISEPRNRSPEMAPAGKTSLLVELPCHADDELWTAADDELVDTVRRRVLEIGWVDDHEVLGGVAGRLPNAYPVLDVSCDAAVAQIHGYLDRFENLRLTGRSGRFVYGWIHNMMRFGLETVAEIADGQAVR